MADLAAYLGVAALVIVVPGPDTALLIRNALGGGRTSGIATAFGVATGQAVWTLVTSLGLAAVLIASEPAFTALRIGGALYLGWLGVHALVDAVRGAAAPGARATAVVPARAYLRGLLSNLGNPKMALFFTSLLPQFAARSFGALAALGLLFCAMTLVWLACYACVVARIGDVLRRSRVRRALDAVTGATLVAFGARLAAER
ncbi:MAG TPA: LysE family translocator [Gaiellaceae bacterium]|nr:LysE family translocator [Gaiellaceae bacterium]